MFRFGCPSCKSVLQVEDPSTTAKVTCSVCGNRLVVPQPAPVRASADLAIRVPAPRIPASPSKQGSTSNQALVIWSIAAAGIFLGFVLCGGLGVAVWVLLSPGKETAKETTETKSADFKKEAAKKAAETDNADVKSVPKADMEEQLPPLHVGADAVKAGTAQEIYERVLKSTVWINNPGVGTGTGVLINADDKLVLTNYHVILQLGTAHPGEILTTINGRLALSDPILPDPKGKEQKHFKSFPYQFTKNVEYQIDMVSQVIDSFLVITDTKGKVLAFDDDGGGNLNARIRFAPPQDGQYVIIATTFESGIGDFKLTVTKIDNRKSAIKEDPKAAAFVTVNAPEFAAGQVIADKRHYNRINGAEPEKFKAKVIAFSVAKDLAVVQLNALPSDCPPLPLAKEGSKPGNAVHSIGNPGASGAMWVYTSGTVRTAPYEKQWQSMGPGGALAHNAVVIETQSPTNPGDSGGPLVNERGELVAIAQGVNLGVNSINLFIDISEIRGFLKSNGMRWAEK